MVQVIDLNVRQAIIDLVETEPQFEARGGYEAADQFDNTIGLWSPPMRSADAEILPDKQMLDSRVRDLLRNDGYAQTGQNLHRDNIVGAMFMLNSCPETRILSQQLKTLDETWAEEFQQEVEAKFTMAAESMSCWFDAAGRMTFTEIIRHTVGNTLAAGEELSLAMWLRESGRPFKTAMMAIDTDRLSTPHMEENNWSVRGGVKIDRLGRPIGVYVRKTHPYDYNLMNMDSLEWDYVPMTKPWGRVQALHIMDIRRPDQHRGISEMVAGLKEMKITKKFRDLTLQGAALGATYAASIESELPSEVIFQQMGGGNTMTPGAAASQYAAEYLGAVQSYQKKSRGLQIDGVKIPHFFPGTKLQLHPAATPGGIGQDFEVSLNRYLSSLLGVSYEELSHDYAKTNYSSMRAAFLNTWRYMSARKKTIADRKANVIYQLWLEEMINTGGIDSLPRNVATRANFYEGLNKEAYCNATWIGASRGQIDELKETQAAVLRIKYGLSTREDELAKLGKDWRRVFQQLEREKKEETKRGLVFVEDNSVNAASGTPRDASTAETDGTEVEGDGDNAD